MRYGFINNFSQVIASDITDTDTAIFPDGGVTPFAGASATYRFPLTLFDSDGNIEIVHVRSAGTTAVAVDRAQEGTTARAWPAGTSIESRFTALIANGIIWSDPAAVASVGYAAVSLQPFRNSIDQVASGSSAVAIGRSSKASATSAVACGPYSSALGSESTAVGDTSYAQGDWSLACGYNATANFDQAIAIGRSTIADSENVVIIGARAQDYQLSDNGVAIGHFANIEGLGSIAIGHGATTYAAGQVAIGPRSYPNQIQSAMDVTAIPVMRSSIQTAQTYQHGTAQRVTLPAILRTPDVSLATTGDKASLDLPANTALMVERIEVVVITSDATTYTPTLSVGTTMGGAEILSAHVMTGSVALSREQLVATPVADAVTALYFKVDAAAAGVMTARLVVHGYVMEV